MDELTPIPKDRTLVHAQDYEFLRAEGLKHIESLSHDLWTDYNAHDPGITILEALCYAITELGYRCGFDMKDLLTDDKGQIVDNQVFFTAKQILINNPLTIDDYRKLLIDIEGVHNAWLLADDFQTDAPDSLILSGLYRVLLDLDEDDRYGDLNNGEIVIENPVTPAFPKGEFWFSVGLPPWKAADYSFAASAADATKLDSAVITEASGNWLCTVTLTDARTGQFNVTLSKKPASGTVTIADVQTMFNDKTFVSLLFTEYLGKITMSKGIVQMAVKTLEEHRNLCEDFLSVTTVDDEKVAFCFDVDVTPATDIEKVQAEIFYAIENYLNPSVDFYSLKELLAKKIPVDQIFEGVVLQHGFIDTLQLEQTQLRTVIHTSDIINLLMDIDGVIAIRNFVMTKYGADGKPVPGYSGLKWCMDITPWHKPVLTADKSKIILFKDQFPFLANYTEVLDTVRLLHAERSRAKLNGLQDDLPRPTGSRRDTESYWPVQYDLPQTYGIGEFGLGPEASALRIVQQRQLKGYLMFYEQLLADFLSQLTNAHKLFSVDTIMQTYYARFLKDIKDMDQVYYPDLSTASLDTAISNPDSTAQPKNKWQQLYEPKDVFEDRRGRFLDHLLARFAESFNDYALLMYRINYNDRTEDRIGFTEITAAKIRTLKAYDDISSNRGKAFNYFPQKNDLTIDTAQLWDTGNVSGLEKRISFLTGIADYTRRFLYCIKNIEVRCEEEKVIQNGEEVFKCYHVFSLTSLSGITMQSGVKYDTAAQAEQAVADVLALGTDKANYRFDTTDNHLKLIGYASETLLVSEATYADENAAMTDAGEMAGEIAGTCNDPVGLHLIEHILLRPRDSSFERMQVSPQDCKCPCEQDPYSFRASVVLPYWPGHFDDMAFRQYFENKIREEAPAHVMLKVCWLSNELMREFEVAYKKWIEMLAAWSLDSQANAVPFRDANDEMIEMLARLHSEYPLATLHDCNESKEGSNVVVLGKTVLGTFKN